jgi:hypothetical protein
LNDARIGHIVSFEEICMAFMASSAGATKSRYGTPSTPPACALTSFPTPSPIEAR